MPPVRGHTRHSLLPRVSASDGVLWFGSFVSLPHRCDLLLPGPSRAGLWSCDPWGAVWTLLCVAGVAGVPPRPAQRAVSTRRHRRGDGGLDVLAWEQLCQLEVPVEAEGWRDPAQALRPGAAPHARAQHAAPRPWGPDSSGCHTCGGTASAGAVGSCSLRGRCCLAPRTVAWAVRTDVSLSPGLRPELTVGTSPTPRGCFSPGEAAWSLDGGPATGKVQEEAEGPDWPRSGEPLLSGRGDSGHQGPEGQRGPLLLHPGDPRKRRAPREPPASVPGSSCVNSGKKLFTSPGSPRGPG